MRAEALREKAREYELRALSLADRDELDSDARRAADHFTLATIVFRELANVERDLSEGERA